MIVSYATLKPDIAPYIYGRSFSIRGEINTSKVLQTVVIMQHFEDYSVQVFGAVKSMT